MKKYIEYQEMLSLNATSSNPFKLCSLLNNIYCLLNNTLYII